MSCNKNIVRAMTLSEVAKELGLTAERVRQIETAALRKIRIALSGRYICGSSDIISSAGDLKQ